LGIKANPDEGENGFRFYKELNDGFPEGSRKVATAFRFTKPCMIKEAIESF